MPITSVTSEALQLKLRQLLPSQQGFGTDLSASDTIIPIIDLTAAAEGSEVRADLQTAVAFGNQTSFNVANATTTVITGSFGFYRMFGTLTLTATTQIVAQIRLNDGSTDKVIWGSTYQGNSAGGATGIPFDFNVFLRVGDSLNLLSDNAGARFVGSFRQIADLNGTLVNPSGFNPQ
tara:strand:+ start:267 stop:797 length:531 start_codon:yes stop_codon:yes gene_type:complete